MVFRILTHLSTRHLIFIRVYLNYFEIWSKQLYTTYLYKIQILNYLITIRTGLFL